MEQSPREISSRKSHEDKDVMSFADVMYIQFNKMATARSDKPWLEYEKAVNSYEMVLAAHFDDLYKKTLWVIERKAEIINNEQGSDASRLYFFDAKGRALAELTGRVNRGEISFRETIDDSDIVREIAHKITQGVGQNLFITGAPGSGKSWTTGSLGEKVTALTGGKFSPHHVGFNLKHFMKIYLDESMTPPGSCVALEEAGVNVNSKNAMTLMNKAFSDVFQTMRYRKLLIILNAPDLSFLERQPRKLLHWWFKTDKVDRSAGFVHIDPRMVEVNQQDGEIYYPRPRFDKTDRITELRVSKPSKAFIDVYEPLQANYKLELARKSEKTINEMDSDDNNELSEKETEYLTKRMEGTTQKDLIKMFNWSKDKVMRIEKYAEKYGFIIPENRGMHAKKSGKVGDIS